MKKLMLGLKSVGLVGILLAIPGAATYAELGGLNGYWNYLFAMSGVSRPNLPNNPTLSAFYRANWNLYGYLPFYYYPALQYTQAWRQQSSSLTGLFGSHLTHGGHYSSN